MMGIALMSFVKRFEREKSPPCDFRWSVWSWWSCNGGGEAWRRRWSSS